MRAAIHRTIPMLSLATALLVTAFSPPASATHDLGASTVKSFAAGRRVVVETATDVLVAARSTSKSRGTQPRGTLGTIVGGPMSANGIRYWQVDFEGPADGWAKESAIASAYFPPSETRGGWRSMVQLDQMPTPTQKNLIRSKVGVDWNKLKLAQDYSRSFTSKSSVLVIRSGHVVGEWGSRAPYAAASVSKSLTGVALAKLFDLSEQNKLATKIGPNDLAHRYLPGSWSAADSRKRQIKISHLMTMTSGIVPDDKPNQSNYYNVILGKGMQTSPGKEWAYASLPVDLLSVAVQGVAKKSLRDFFNQNIATPVGMAPVAWTNFSGYTMASSGVSISPRDLARVGYLKMMNGMWDSGSGQKAVVSARNMQLLRSWSSSTGSAKYRATPGSPFPLPSTSPQHYGHLWWTNRTGVGLGEDVPRDAYYAHGYKESLLVVVPSLNLVVVRYGPLPLADKAFRREFMEKVMAAIVK